MSKQKNKQMQREVTFRTTSKQRNVTVSCRVGARASWWDAPWQPETCASRWSGLWWSPRPANPVGPGTPGGERTRPLRPSVWANEGASTDVGCWGRNARVGKPSHKGRAAFATFTTPRSKVRLKSNDTLSQGCGKKWEVINYRFVNVWIATGCLCSHLENKSWS